MGDIKNMITVNNSNNPKYEALFDDLIGEVFGFSFAPWFKFKLWDKNYESYSIIKDKKMLANVCIYKSKIIVQGEKVQTIRFGAVATRKDLQGKGLSRCLIEHIFKIYPNTLALLTANSSVVNFYPRFGFRQVPTFKPEIDILIDNDSTKAIKLEFDDPFLMKLLYSRNCYSNIVDCLNTQSIQIFHLLMEYQNDIYYLPNLEVVVVAKQDGNRLFLADVVSNKHIIFEQITSELPFAGVEIVEFGFSPDWLGVSPTWIPVKSNDDPFFIRGDWNLPANYCFPIMSET